MSDSFLTDDVPNEKHRIYFDNKRYFYVESASYFIEKGSFGRVYNCFETQLIDQNIKLCVKVFFLVFQYDTGRQFVQNELDIVKMLVEQKQNYSENLVKIIDIIKETHDELVQIFIIMEKCDGDLSKLMKTHKKKTVWFTRAEQIDIFNQILQGYKFLFDNKIVHRDLKPQNILYQVKDGKTIYKIADFGLSKIVQDACKTNMITQVGTYNYQSPQILFQENYTYKVDIYSLGIIFYKIIFNGENPQQKNGQNDNLQFQRQLKESKVFQYQQFPNQSQYDKDISQLLQSMITYYEHDRMGIEDLLKLPILKYKYQNTKIRITNQTKYDPMEDITQLRIYLEIFLEYTLGKFKIISEFILNIYKYQDFINNSLYISQFHLQMIITCLMALSHIQLDYTLGFINNQIELIPVEFNINAQMKTKFFGIINEFKKQQSEQSQNTKYECLYNQIREVEQRSQLQYQLKEQKNNALLFIQNNMHKKADQRNILNEIRDQFRTLLEKDIKIQQLVEYFYWIHFFYYKLWPQAESNQLSLDNYIIYLRLKYQFLRIVYLNQEFSVDKFRISNLIEIKFTDDMQEMVKYIKQVEDNINQQLQKI